MKNILLLGGNGFIGSNLIEEFLEFSDEFRLIVFDRPGKIKRYGSGIVTISGDFSNPEDLAKVFSERKIDIVMHLISTTVPASSNEKVVHDIEANLIPTVRLLKLMAEFKIPEIIFLSSGGSVYGITGLEKIKETHATFPVSSHGTIKLTIEKYIHLFQELYGINYLILRVGNAYGPYQVSDEQGIINVFIRNIISNKPLVIRGDGTSVRDYIYVKDLACIIRKLIANGVTNEIINIGSGQGTTINQILSILSSIAKKEYTNIYSDPLLTDVPGIVLDTEKLKSYVDFELISLEEGVKRTFLYSMSELK